MSSPFLNQLSKELRQHQLLLALWAGLLLLFTVKELGETGAAADLYGNFRGGPAGNQLAMAGLFMIALVLPLALGLGDSRADSRGFLHTRPVPLAAVWCAKLVIVVACLALPAALVPMVVGFGHGAGAGEALLAGIDRAAFLLPALLFVLCWGGLFRGGGQCALWAIIAAALVFAGVLCGVFTLGAERAERMLEEPGSFPARLLVTLWAGAAIAALALWRQLARGAGRALPLSVSGGIAVATMLAFNLPGLNFLRSEFALPEEVAGSLGALEVQPDPYSIHAWRFVNQQSGETELNVNAAVRVAGLPGGLTFAPKVKGASLEPPAGAPFRSLERRGATRRVLNPQVSRGVLDALAESLGGGATLHVPERGSDFEQRDKVTVGWQLTDSLRDHLGGALDLELQLEFDAIEVTALGTLPMKDGAVLKDGRWDLTLMRPPWGGQDTQWFSLRARAPQRFLTRDEGVRARRDWQMSYRYLCVLAFPDRDWGTVCPSDGVQTSGGIASGFPERVWMFRNDRQAVPGDPDAASSFDAAKLHVFRLAWVGEHAASARVAGLRLDRRMDHAGGSSNTTDDPAAYRRAFELLGDLPDKPGAADVDATLRLMDALDSWRTDASDPAFARLLEIGRRDLDLLLDGVGRSGSRSQYSLLAAIGQLAGGGDRERILARLEDRPGLAPIVVENGWEEGARAELAAALQSRRPLPYEALVAVVLLGEEGLYPLLLEQFAHRPSMVLFDLLWRVPALRPELERAVAERWAKVRRGFVWEHALGTDDINLAVRIGDPLALDYALRAYRRGSRYRALQLLRPVMLLPEAEAEVGAALAGLGADAFEFDPERRLFKRRGDR